MGVEDEHDKRPVRMVTVGEDLATHSIDELTERIAALEAEIERCRSAIAEKSAVKSAADSLFR